jgi:outer membrane protein assembly factor BamB
MKMVGAVLKWFVIVVLVVVAGFTILHKFFNLRVELLGQGYKPHFYFFDPEKHYSELEKHRAAQKAAAPTTVLAAAPLERTPDKAPEKAAAPVMPKTVVTTPPYWTNFRGPHRDGVYDETPVNTAWPAAGLPVLWKQPIGGGYASFVVAAGRAFTIEQRRDKEVVAAYDVDSGRELWTNGWPALFSETMGGDGPRATPTWDDGRVYALGATGELRCLRAESGERLWSRNILTENQASNLQWGMSASPLVVDDKVVVLPGGGAGRSVVAYNKLTGKEVWASQNDKQGYASPKLVTIDGEPQIVVVSATRVMGLKVGDGRLLWEFPWYTSPEVNATEPVFLDDHRFFISSGYDHGAVLVDVSRTGESKARTLDGAGDTFSAKQLWFTKRMKTRFNAAVYYQGYLYGLDEGILSCLDAANGELKWKGGRYGYGQVLLASGHLIVLTEDGDLALVKASPEKLEEISRFSVLDGKTWNYPAIDGGRLLVRNSTQMAALKIM